jgi:hypothetical protein
VHKDRWKKIKYQNSMAKFNGNIKNQWQKSMAKINGNISIKNQWQIPHPLIYNLKSKILNQLLSAFDA